MRKTMAIVSICLGVMFAPFMGASDAQAGGFVPPVTFGGSSPQEMLDASLAQIELYEANGWDVTKEMYDFYFELASRLNPEAYVNEGIRGDGRESLDQLANSCPGTLILGPPKNEPMTLRTCGSTISATNSCSYPTCRLGRDVVMQLEVFEDDEVHFSTCGTRFDATLCIYSDDCCDGGALVGQYHGNPSMCNDPLQAGAIVFLNTGTYHIVLDGAGPSAYGSYCLNIQFLGIGGGEGENKKATSISNR